MALTVTAPTGTLSVGAAQGTFTAVPGVVGYMPQALTVSGNEITDAVRAAGVSGDGRQNDSSFGVWPAATNLCTNSGFEVDTSSWTTSGGYWSNSGATLVRVTSTAQFGTASGYFTTPGSSAAEGAGYTGFAVTSGQAYTCSAWLKGSGTIHLAVGDGTVGTAQSSNITLTPTFTRYALSFTPTGSGTTRFVIAVPLGTTAAITCNIDGVQLETGPIATPYTPSSRAAARVQLSADYLSPVQMWAAFRLRMGWPNTTPPVAYPVLFEQTDGTAANRLLAYYHSGNWSMESDAASLSPTVAVADTFALSDMRTIIPRVTASAVGLSVNGGAFANTPRTATPVGLNSTMDILQYLATGHFASDILWACFGTGTLSDADAAMLNALTRDPVVTDFSHANNATVIWTADTATALMGAAV